MEETFFLEIKNGKNRKLYHNYLFLFGFVYYLILPLIVAVFKILPSDYPGMQLFYNAYDEEALGKYLLLLFVVFISFYSGSLLPLMQRQKSNIHRCKGNYISSRDLSLFSLPFFIYGQVLVFQNIGNLFRGYKVEYDMTFLGSISTLNTLFLFLAIYNKGKNYEMNKYFSLYIYLSIIEFSIVLLGMGSRMYILIPSIAFLIFLLDQKKISWRKCIFWGGSAALIFILIGMWRIGSDVTSDIFLYMGVAEPVFTWISAISMLSEKNLPLLAFPSNFISSFLNFIPTVLFPNKNNFIYPIDLSYDSPFGATSLLLSLVANFGILGSGVAMFLLGFYFTIVRINFKGLFGQTYYYCICGIIAFQLFRDGISIVNKMFFYNFLILPFLLFLIIKMLRYFSLRKKHGFTS